MKAVRPVAGRLGLRSSTARRSKPLGKRNATVQAVEGNLGGFCVVPRYTQKRPRRGRRDEAVCVELQLVGLGEVGQQEVLALRYGLGCLFSAIPLGLRRALRLRLCGVADSLCQHLAQLSLGFRRSLGGFQ